MSNQEKIEMLEQAIDLVCEAQNLVDEVMEGDSHYESYGKYGFLQLLGNYLAEEVEGRANAKNDLAKELESLANDLCEESVTFKTGFFADVCNSAIKLVNFYEIAESYLEEL